MSPQDGDIDQINGTERPYRGFSGVDLLRSVFDRVLSEMRERNDARTLPQYEGALKVKLAMLVFACAADDDGDDFAALKRRVVAAAAGIPGPALPTDPAKPPERLLPRGNGARNP